MIDNKARKLEKQRNVKGTYGIKKKIKEVMCREGGITLDQIFDVCPKIDDHYHKVDFNALIEEWPHSIDKKAAFVCFCNYPWRQYSAWFPIIKRNFEKGANMIVLALESTFEHKTWKSYFEGNPDVIYGESFRAPF